MDNDDDAGLRAELRSLLRRGRFHGWSTDELEEHVLALFGRGVSTQTPAQPDQLPGPPSPAG